MKRRYHFAACLLFLAGILALDVALIDRHGVIRELLNAELEDQLAVRFDYARPRIEFDFLRPTLILEDLTLTTSKDSNEPAFTCRKISMGLDWGELRAGRVALRRIDFEQPRIHLYWVKDVLQVPVLFKGEARPKEEKIVIPDVSTSDLAVHLHSPPFFARGGGAPIVIEPVRVDFDHRPSRDFPYGFTGAIGDSMFGDFELEGRFGDDRISGSITYHGKSLDERIVGLLREDLREALDGVETEGDLTLTLAFASDDIAGPIDYDIGVKMERFKIRHHGLPTDIEMEKGEIKVERDRIYARTLDFELNEAPVRVTNAVLSLPDDDRPLEASLHASISRFNIGNRLLDSIKNLDVEPFSDIRDALEAFGVEGHANIELDLKVVPGRSGVVVNADIQLDGASLAYQGYADPVTQVREGYPYRVRNLIGRIQIDNRGMRFDDLITKSADQFIEMSGSVVFGQDFAFDVRVEGNEIPLGEEVRAALPHSDRLVYDSYAPKGYADLLVEVKREPHTTSEQTDVRVEIDMRLVEARPAVFPVLVRSVGGRLVFQKGEPARLEKVHAYRGEGTIDIDGEVTFGREGEPDEFGLDIRAHDIDLDDELIDAISVEFPDVAAEMRRQAMAGRFDLDARVGGNEDSPPRFIVAMRDMRMRLEQIPSIPITGLTGTARIEDETMTLANLRFRAVDRDLEGDGVIELGRDPSWKLQVRGRDLLVDAEAINAVGREIPAVTDLARDYEIAGRLGVELDLLRDAKGKEETRVGLDLGDLTLRDRTGPLRVTEVRGRVDIRDDAITFRDLTGVVPWTEDAAAGEPASRATFSLVSGGLRRGGPLDLDLSQVAVRNLVLRDEVFALLPEGPRDTLRSLGLRGRLDFELSTLRAREGRVVFRGVARPEALRGDTGLDVVLRDGELKIDSGVIADGRFEVKGRLEKGRVRIERFSIDEVSAPFSLSQSRLKLDSIAARFLEGTLQPARTSFELLFEAGNLFDVRANAVGADLSEFLRQVGGRPTAFVGKANVIAGLTGRFGDLDSFAGEGTVKMTGRELYELPFFALVFQIINFDFLTNSSNEPQRGEIGLVVRDRKVHIDRARFEGPGVNLDGSGDIGFDGIVDLAFEPKPIKWVDSIPIVGDLFEIGSGIIVDQVRLTGPIENPRARVGNYITEILPSTPDSGRRLIIRPMKDGAEGAEGEKKP
ncbi:MAG: hypothetical protein R3F20_07185 [Planctomycetota bacterium]